MMGIFYLHSTVPYTLMFRKTKARKWGFITVEVDPEKLREDSVTYQGKGRPLNSYQHAVNGAAMCYVPIWSNAS